MDLTSSFLTLAISLGLGLLVGMQRERVNAPLAGVRTFALISLLGSLAGMLSWWVGPWVVAVGFVCVVLTIVIGNVLSMRQERPDPGITTEIAILLMYGIGVYLVFGHRPLAVVLAGGVTVLLHAKPSMHGFVARLGENDMRAIMQFVLITLVILPVLPDRAYGSFQVLNPREIWWMVVLVVGMSLAGYVALKLYGERAGVVLGGLIGGLVSSTATTVSQARRAARTRGKEGAATLIILLASTVLYVRVLVEVGVAAGALFARIAPPLSILLGLSILLCIVTARRSRDVEAETSSQENPTELKSALIFGVLYGAVLLAVAAAKEHFGDRGFYVAAGISGLTDMDAITLTASRMAARSAVSPGTAWRAILIATMANLIFKTGIVAVLGGSKLARRIGLLFAVQLAASLALLALWPW